MLFSNAATKSDFLAFEAYGTCCSERNEGDQSPAPSHLANAGAGEDIHRAPARSLAGLPP